MKNSNLASAGKLLAEAFFDNPAHVYLFPDVRARQKSLAWLLENNFKVHAPLEDSFCRTERRDNDRHGASPGMDMTPVIGRGTENAA